MSSHQAGALLWTPDEARVCASRLSDYMRWLEREHGHAFADYEALWRWSTSELEAFWRSIARYFAVRMTPSERVLSSHALPGAHWFEGATLNYAEHALLRTGSEPAILYRHENGARRSLSWDELRDAVARARAGFVRLGVGKGDRVAAYLPNCPEAVIAFLACASLGATWSSCSPEFGVESVLDRFTQIAPKVLLAVDAYEYAGKTFERSAEVAAIVARLPSLARAVIVPRGDHAALGMTWAELTAEHAPLAFTPCSFEHPLWILYSSGTTGQPKAIVQGHGGILLEHVKSLALHCDLGPSSRFFWFTTTGWMMWNYLVSGLTVGATLALYEGSPTFPDSSALFRFAAEERITFLGTSAPFIVACDKEGLAPAATLDFGALRALGSTGAPLPVAGYAWVYEKLKADVHLACISGGTDVCTAFLTSCPLLPVYAGEMQCRALGAKVEAFSADAQPLIGQVGELVISEPMPSMPLYFLNDADGERMRASYFADFPNVWRHGDFVEITERGTSLVYGRSDATLNRGGVRMGTAELYRIVEALPELRDSLVVDTGALDREDVMWLFVVLAPGLALDDALTQRIRSALRSGLSPRHVPDRIAAIAAVPRTLNGKKVEVPIKRILMGMPRERAIQPGTLSNPEAVDALLQAVRG